MRRKVLIHTQSPSGRLFLAVVLIASLARCQVPAYLVTPSDVAQAQSASPPPTVPAIRERGGGQVRLRSGSFLATSNLPRLDGLLEVKGPGRRGSRWKAGAAVFGIGWGLAAIGGGIMARGPGDFGAKQFLVGSGIFAVGAVGWLIVGPALWISGAQQKPEEVSWGKRFE